MLAAAPTFGRTDAQQPLDAVGDIMYGRAAGGPCPLGRDALALHDPFSADPTLADRGLQAPYRADDFNDAEKEELMTGTTIMACRFPGGVALAADSRTSMGAYVSSRCSRKISKIHDRIFVCRSGSAADTQYLSSMVARYMHMHGEELRDAKPTVNSAAHLFHLLGYYNRDNLMAGLIVAGFDDKRGGEVYHIPAGGAKVPVPYVVGGSGSVFVQGFVQDNYRPDFSKEEAVGFCKRTVRHAVRNDGSSGGLVRVVIVTKDGPEETAYVAESDE